MLNGKGALAPHHIGNLLLRSLAGLALIYYQGAFHLQKAWSFLWENSDWPLVDYFAQDYGTALGVTLAFLIAIFYCFCPIFLIAGFLTRLSALVLFFGLLATFYAGAEEIVSTSLHNQTLVLYFVIMLHFAFTGGGALAVDRLFTRKTDNRPVEPIREGIYA